MPEFQTNCTVIQVEHLGADIFRLTLEAPDIAEVVRPAQFVMVSCGTDQDPLLRRPFSVHGKQAGGCIQLLFKIVGRVPGRLSALSRRRTHPRLIAR